jgi:predicted AAA+ superfamily ATPase
MEKFINLFTILDKKRKKCRVRWTKMEKMDKNQIIEILEEWNFWKHELETGMERKEYVDRALKFLEANVVVALVGVRRAGKSFLMRQLAKKLAKAEDKRNILMVNFEDERFTHLDTKLLNQIYETYLEVLKPKEKPFIFLDEVHRVDGWEKWVRRMHELNKARLIISGSSAKLLQGELATLLTGRHLDLVVFPLSFKEFLLFKGITIKEELDIVAKKIEIRRLFDEYLEFGGFPAVVMSKEKKQLLLTYFDDVLTKDVERRYKIKKGNSLRTLAKFCLTNISNPITFNSLKKFLSLSTDTVEKFLSYLEEVYLIFSLKRFSKKFKEQEKAARKIYAIDVGMARAIGFRLTENKGAAFENLVFIELLRKKALNPLLEIYYWKNPEQQEVDFVLKEGTKIKQLIQVCYDLSEPKTKDREIRALLKASKELNCDSLLIITEDYEGEENIKEKKIKFVPLWKWLLQNS